MPYFIADNRGEVDEILQSKMMDKFKDDSAQSSNLIEDNQYRGSLFARTLNNVQTKLISRRLKDLDTLDGLSTKASELLSKAVGNAVAVSIDHDLMDIGTAKAHITELISITRDYELRQGKLTEIRLGYTPSSSLEQGCTSYTPSDNSKRINLTSIIDDRSATKADRNSRCDKDRLPFSLAAHESAHLLFNFDAPASGELLFFHQAVMKEYQQYIQEIYQLFSQNKSIDEVSIGDYGTSNGVGEFMAECFQEYINSRNPSKYARKVGKIIDTYFKK